MDFCSKSNICEALQQLSDEVAILGLSPIPEHDNKHIDSTSIDVLVSLSNIVWELLKSRQKVVDKVRESNQHQCTLNDEIKCLKTKIKHLEDKLAQNDKLVNSSLKQETVMKNRKAVVETDMKKLKQELLRAQGLLKSRSEQTTLKMKELQEENAELKKKLMKVLMNNPQNVDNTNSKTQPAEYVTVKHANKAHSSHALESSLSTKRELLFRKSILKLQNNVQTLALENIKLKKSLDDNPSYSK